MTTREQVVAILKEVLPAVDSEGITTLIDDAYIESMELMMLISMINEKFGIEIGFEEIAPENFNSVDAIASMIDRLTA